MRDVRFVVSPFATLRARLGGWVMTSPSSSRTATVSCELLPVIADLATPRRLQDVAKRHSNPAFHEKDILGALDLLADLGALERAPAPLEAQAQLSGAAWDPDDRAFYDIRCQQILHRLQGFASSFDDFLPRDGDGALIPWFSYPAVDYLKRLDLSDKTVFEYGGGASTFYWAKHARSVVCVEDDARWYDKLARDLAGRARVKLRIDVNAYADSILEDDARYDIIVLDSSPRTRPACGRRAASGLAQGGMVILDDATHYTDVAETLRRTDLIEVDMTGFAALEAYTQTTSFFLHRQFRFHARGGVQPARLPGAPGYEGGKGR